MKFIEIVQAYNGCRMLINLEHLVRVSESNPYQITLHMMPDPDYERTFTIAYLDFMHVFYRAMHADFGANVPSIEESRYDPSPKEEGF